MLSLIVTYFIAHMGILRYAFYIINIQKKDRLRGLFSMSLLALNYKLRIQLFPQTSID